MVLEYVGMKLSVSLIFQKIDIVLTIDAADTYLLELQIPGEPGNRITSLRESGIRLPRTRITPLRESGI